MPTRTRILLVACFSVLMTVCAAMTNAGMDALWSRYDVSVFSTFPAQRQWLDPKISWHNKWKNGDRAQGDRFFLSSTTLVVVTDAWHFLKWLTIWFAALALVAPFTLVVRLRWWVWLLVLLAQTNLFGLVFESFYAHALIVR